MKIQPPDCVRPKPPLGFPTQKGLKTVIYNLLEAIRYCAVLLAPFLPATSEKILSVFNEANDWDSLESFGKLLSGTQLCDCGILFMRIDEDKLLQEIFDKHN